jgi:hypothetical protein
MCELSAAIAVGEICSSNSSFALYWRLRDGAVGVGVDAAVAATGLDVPRLEGGAEVDDVDCGGTLQAVARTRIVRKRETQCRLFRDARRTRSGWQKVRGSIVDARARWDI